MWVPKPTSPFESDVSKETKLVAKKSGETWKVRGDAIAIIIYLKCAKKKCFCNSLEPQFCLGRVPKHYAEQSRNWSKKKTKPLEIGFSTQNHVANNGTKNNTRIVFVAPRMKSWKRIATNSCDKMDLPSRRQKRTPKWRESCLATWPTMQCLHWNHQNTQPEFTATILQIVKLKFTYIIVKCYMKNRRCC